MSTIRKRNNKYQVQVRTQGQQITKHLTILKMLRNGVCFMKVRYYLGVDLQALIRN